MKAGKKKPKILKIQQNNNRFDCFYRFFSFHFLKNRYFSQLRVSNQALAKESGAHGLPKSAKFRQRDEIKIDKSFSIQIHNSVHFFT